MAGEARLICASSDLLEGGKGVIFTVDRKNGPIPAFAIRFQGLAYAYLNQCGHLPAALDWLPGEFFDDSKLYLICSVHGALFAPDTGRCLSGRCRGQGLQPVAVSEREGNIYLLEAESQDE